MLAPLQQPRRNRQIRSAALTVPPPIEGWVSKNDPRSESLTTARILENMIPRRNFAESRLGNQATAKITTGGVVESLMSFEDGNSKKLLAVCENVIYDTPFAPTDIPPAPTSIHTGLTSSRFQSVLMANGADEMRLVMVNGADGILTYEPSAGVQPVVPVPSVPDLLDVTPFKGRLWFTQEGTSTLWYAEPLSNQPSTLTPFYVGPLLQKGGTCLAIDSLSLDGGSGPDDYLAVITTKGECLLFSGIDPATDFQMVGLYDVGLPAGVKCMTKLGKELYYFSSRGPETLSRLMGGLGRVDNAGNPIQDHFEDAYKRAAGSHGWEVLLYSKDSWVICNIPIQYPSNYHQYVLNLETSAWFKITGWNANSWAAHDGEVFYGCNSGVIHIANYGLHDNGAAIEVDYMQNWNEYGTPNLKKFNLCKMTLRSISKPRPAIDMMVDYVELTPTNQPEFPKAAVATPWNISPWNTSPWSSSPIFSVDIFGLSDQGYVGALRYRESVKDSFTQLYGYQIMLEVGDLL